ncbi:hypothetical protein Tco_0189668 [Tanacetum coccineum]
MRSVRRSKDHCPKSSTTRKLLAHDVPRCNVKAIGRVKFLVVAIDYFMKWVEATPLATITADSISSNKLPQWHTPSEQADRASRQEGQKKLDPNWEGPYQIVEAKRPGMYVLADMHGKTISRTWHAGDVSLHIYAVSSLMDTAYWMSEQ